MIEVVRGDLAGTAAQAILRPVAAEWTAVTGSLKRLEPLMGPAVEEQCRTMGELPPGTALVTGAGGLDAEFVIHVVIRSLHQQVTQVIVARGLEAALGRADEWGIESLALPPVGVGAGNLDAEESAAVIVPILVEWQRTDRHPRQISIVVETEYERDVFDRAVRQASETPVEAPDLPLLDP
jgi:O-acetyl-ADP-ribose deacetylase